MADPHGNLLKLMWLCSQNIVIYFSQIMQDNDADYTYTGR